MLLVHNEGGVEHWLYCKKLDILSYRSLSIFAGLSLSKFEHTCLYVRMISKRRVKVQMKCFFIAEFERAAKFRKVVVYRFLISLLVPEL